MSTKIQKGCIQVDAAVPAVLTDYLKELIISNHTIRRIRLVPNKLGWSEAQDIICETSDQPVSYRVFGFPPVNVCLKVAWGKGEGKITVS